jgi:hypothetical protein
MLLSQTHPLLFLAANGEPARALSMDEYAKIGVTSDGKAEKMATPDKKVLARAVKTSGVPFKAMTVTTAASFQSRCLAQRHCLLLLTNTTTSPSASAARALAALGEGIASAHRLARIVVADGAQLDFSLAGALPAETPWPLVSGGGSHDFNGPRALYLRALTTKERQAMATAAAPTPPPAVLPGNNDVSVLAPTWLRLEARGVVSASLVPLVC